MTASGPDQRRIAVRITPDALRQVRGGHPWIYAESITSLGGPGAPGDLAVIFDDRRRFAAIGLYDPGSPIRIKVLHRGRPATIDGAWWRERIAEAADRRRTIAAPGDTTGYRVVHGENDGLPGLVVDRYGETVVVKLYSEALVVHLDAIHDGVRAAIDPARVVVRASRLVASTLPAGLADGTTTVGAATDAPVEFDENGLTFAADVVRGQKTGHFLDQRDNRALIRRHAVGAAVLDVFSCSGGFAVHAAAGGARSVHLVDSSPGAIEAAARNRRLNIHDDAVARCAFSHDVGDAFDVMASLAARRASYAIVVVDPPSFARSQSQVPRALQAYRRLVALALPLVEPGGRLLLASCSGRVSTEQFVTLVGDESARQGYELDEVVVSGQPLDHPVGFAQGAYLKAVFGRPRRR